MTLAARLVLQTGASVVLARCERLSWGRGYTLYFEEWPMTDATTLDACVLQINLAMEKTIRQCPEQYLWGYGRYKQPRVGAAKPQPFVKRRKRMSGSKIAIGFMHVLAKLPLPMLRGLGKFGGRVLFVVAGQRHTALRCAILSSASPMCPKPGAKHGRKSL